MELTSRAERRSLLNNVTKPIEDVEIYEDEQFDDDDDDVLDIREINGDAPNEILIQSDDNNTKSLLRPMIILSVIVLIFLVSTIITFFNSPVNENTTYSIFTEPDSVINSTVSMKPTSFPSLKTTNKPISQSKPSTILHTSVPITKSPVKNDHDKKKEPNMPTNSPSKIKHSEKPHKR